MDSKLEHTLRLRHLEQLRQLPINQSPPPVKRLPGNQLHVTPAWINQATTDTLSIIQEAVASGASRLLISCTHTHERDQARAASTLPGFVCVLRCTDRRASQQAECDMERRAPRVHGERGRLPPVRASGRVRWAVLIICAET
jgi:hypothetical protein